MPNIADAEDAWLEGSLDFEEFLAEFDMEFFAPLGEVMLSALAESFAALPPEVRQQLEQLAPGALDAVLGGLGNASTNSLQEGQGLQEEQEHSQLTRLVAPPIGRNR